MRESRLRAVWNQSACAINGWLLSPAPLGAEMLAGLEWDSLLIDMQHGAIDYQDVYALCLAISPYPVTPLVRVPANDSAVIMKALDAGAYGIMCPMINTRDDAEAFVRACRYPPHGERSFGPTRASLYGGPDYFARANETIVTLAQIETRAALDNIADIVQAEGLDAVYVGSADLSISMGGPAAIRYDDPVVEEQHRRIVDAAHAAGVRVGMHALSVEDARRVMSWGADLVSLASDASFALAAAGEMVGAVRGGLAANGLHRAGDAVSPYVPAPASERR